MAKLEPTKSNYLAVGAWNPAIIQPSWLRKEFPEVVPETIGIEIIAPSLGVRFDLEKFFLEPSNGRLIFFPKEINVETLTSISELSDGIIGRLQYTPITAAGCNFSFSLDSHEMFSVDELNNVDNAKDISKIIGSTSDIVSHSIQHTYSLENHNININYDCNGKEKTLRINFDYQTPDAAMIEASKNLVINYEKALEISEQLIITI